MAEDFTTTYTCDSCGKQVLEFTISDWPAFWLVVSFRNADPDAEPFTAHYCRIQCLLDSISRFAGQHVGQDWTQ